MPFLRRLSGLQWKLTISYVGVTLLTVLALEIIAVLAVSWFGPRFGGVWVRRAALNRAERMAELVADAIETQSPECLTEALDQSTGLVLRILTWESAGLASEQGRWNDVAHVVIGTRGYVIASNQANHYPGGYLFSEPGLPEAERAVSEALANNVTASDLIAELDVLFAAVPLTDSAGAKLGVLYYRQPALDVAGLSLRDLWQPLLVTTAVLLPCMILLGLVFGSVAAIGFTRRLRRLVQASRALAGSDQDGRVHDPPGDEIGQLGRQLNAIAEQIQADAAQLHELTEQNDRLAQQLTALEERHRLARELHDGVREHLFNVNLTTALALNLLDIDPKGAHAKLLEAREHSRKAQSEMQALLEDLRSASLDDKDRSVTPDHTPPTTPKPPGMPSDAESFPNRQDAPSQ
jgi:signal transduction histidine kinase